MATIDQFRKAAGASSSYSSQRNVRSFIPRATAQDRRRGSSRRGSGRAAPAPFDPQLSAFLRAMGVQEQQVRAQGRQQGALASRQVARQDGQFDQRIGDAANEISGDAESRGVYRSGGTVARLADSRNRIEGERNEVQATLRDQLQGIQYDTAARVAELRRQAAEERLSGRSRVGERRAQSVYGGAR